MHYIFSFLPTELFCWRCFIGFCFSTKPIVQSTISLSLCLFLVLHPGITPMWTQRTKCDSWDWTWASYRPGKHLTCCTIFLGPFFKNFFVLKSSDQIQGPLLPWLSKPMQSMHKALLSRTMIKNSRKWHNEQRKEISTKKLSYCFSSSGCPTQITHSHTHTHTDTKCIIPPKLKKLKAYETVHSQRLDIAGSPRAFLPFSNPITVPKTDTDIWNKTRKCKNKTEIENIHTGQMGTPESFKGCHYPATRSNIQPEPRDRRKHHNMGRAGLSHFRNRGL